ncbi:30S ribosomal protein S4 [Candidatus Izimaplasma bacterium ZiA1]|uniref:30S ribosomal protein S4 n=1 Tax=Candidatus Izimoplasma sp. ZiA1 TaxID=2024899 RepID=UPI000BAA7DF7|nr:30S ribosomal protein S4 [Candidatus Izimaplasma bacterium ZiA1]
MSKYTGPSWKISRRLKYSISESGKELAKRPYPPGQHGQRRTKVSEFGLQLQEKQKVRFTYGVNEKQFKKIFNDAKKLQGKQGENFLFLLESRLDNLVFRAGFATTRRAARQLVNHGHIFVDGRRLDIPSYRVLPGQVVSLSAKASKFSVIADSLESKVSRPDYVDFDEKKVNFTFVRLPERQEILSEIKENLIVEFYNR